MVHCFSLFKNVLYRNAKAGFCPKFKRMYGEDKNIPQPQLIYSYRTKKRVEEDSRKPRHSKVFVLRGHMIRFSLSSTSVITLTIGIESHLIHNYF